VFTFAMPSRSSSTRASAGDRIAAGVDDGRDERSAFADQERVGTGDVIDE
jgi:hypothetical protein